MSKRYLLLIISIFAIGCGAIVYGMNEPADKQSKIAPEQTETVEIKQEPIETVEVQVEAEKPVQAPQKSRERTVEIEEAPKLSPKELALKSLSVELEQHEIDCIFAYADSIGMGESTGFLMMQRYHFKNNPSYRSVPACSFLLPPEPTLDIKILPRNQ